MENFNSWHVITAAKNASHIKNIYFLLSTPFDNAFSHWVFECGIYLPLYKYLKSMYPEIKLYLKEFKCYKLLFCKYFNINEDDIVYTIDSNNSNICYNSSPISALNEKAISTQYMNQVDRLWDFFKNKDNSDLVYKLNIMPRQKKENLVGNDRFVDFSKIVDLANNIKNSIIVHTDEIESLDKQIDYIRKSEIIILVDGSAFQVNGMFSYDKTIIVSGPLFSIHQKRDYPKLCYFVDKVISQNSVIFTDNPDDALKYVQKIL